LTAYTPIAGRFSAARIMRGSQRWPVEVAAEIQIVRAGR